MSVRKIHDLVLAGRLSPEDGARILEMRRHIARQRRPWWHKLLAGLAAAIGLTGCSSPSHWRDVPRGEHHASVVTPIAPEPHRAEWEDIVRRSVATWNATLAAEGCFAPFRVGPNGHPVTLIEIHEWRHGVYCGLKLDDRIDVRTDCATEPVVLHELGHALGLEHAPDGADAVMVRQGPDRDEPSEWDVTAAVRAMGCGR